LWSSEDVLKHFHFWMAYVVSECYKLLTEGV